MAAGVGSRLEPLTTQVPKPMVPIANRPVMEHIFDLLRTHGITDVISNLHYQAEKIQAHFGDGSQIGMNLQFHEEKELSGDAGGVRACAEFLRGGTFVVLMGDLLTDADLTKVIAEHKAKKALATIAVKQVPDVRHFGVVVMDESGFIKGFQEKPEPEVALSNYASTGIYILEPEVFDHIPKTGQFGFGRQLFPNLVELGLPVLGVSIDEYYWSDVGTIGQYRSSNFDALDGKVRLNMSGERQPNCIMEAGSSVSSDARIEGKLYLGRNSHIAPSVTIKGYVLIGDNCRIENNAVLDNTIVWSNTVVERGAVLTNSVVGLNCTVPAGTTHNEIASVSLAPTLLGSTKEKEAV